MSKRSSTLYFGVNGKCSCLFDLILYIPVNNFSYVGTGLPGLNQY